MGRKKKIEKEIKKPVKEKIKPSSKLKGILSALEKTYGEGVIASANDILDSVKIPSKVLLLDFLLKGGIPNSTINVFYGDESSGKTLISLLFAAIFTKQKKSVAFIDLEHSYTNAWAKKNGIDTDYLYVSQPDDFEKAIDITDTLVRSGECALVVFDSLTSAIPKTVLDKSAYDKHMGIQAKLNTDLVQKLTSGLQPENLKNPETYNNTIVILVGHLREKIGQMWGNPEHLPGGHALRHHAHNIIRFKRGKVIEKDKKPIGREIRLKVEKAKFSPPLVSGVTEFLFEPPKFNNSKTLIVYGTQLGLIKQAGAYYEYADFKVQGKQALIDALKERPELLRKLKTDIIDQIK